MSVGFLGHMGLKQETVFGTEATPPTIFGEIADESILMDNNLIIPKLCSGTRYIKRVLPGPVTCGGTVNLPMFPQDLTGWLLKGLMGTVSSSLVAAGVYDHTYSTLQSSTLPSFTIQIDKEAQAINWIGSTVASIGIATTPNDLINMAVDIISQYPHEVAAATPSYGTLDPFAAYDVAITLNSEANVDFENLSLTITNDLEGVSTLNNQRWIAKNVAKGFDVTGSFSLEMGDSKMMRRLWGSAVATQPLRLIGPIPLVITITSPVAITGAYYYTCTITIPNCYFSTATANVSAENRIIQECAFVTKYDASSDYQAQIVLRNSQASYPDP